MSKQVVVKKAATIRQEKLKVKYGSRSIAAAAPIVIAGIATALASVGSTVVVARLLVPREYGALTQLLGLFFILSMPGSALMVGVVQRVVHWNSSGENWRVKPWLLRVELVCFGFLMLFLVAIWLLQGDIAEALSLPNSRGVFETLTAGALWVIVSVNRGVLQAGKTYRWLGWNLALEGIIRTAFMIGLAAIGLGILGASSGIMIGEAAALIHGIAGVSLSVGPGRRGNGSLDDRQVSLDDGQVLPGNSGTAGEQDGSMEVLKGDGAGGSEGELNDHTQELPREGMSRVYTKPRVHGRRELAGDVVTAFASLGLIAILQYADVVMVGAYSPSHAGAYGAVSVSAKSLVAWTILLTNYLLPEAAIRWRVGGHAINELRNTIVLAILPALLMLAIALSVPSLFLGLAFGDKLEGAAPSFPYLTAAMAFLSVTVIFSSYFFGVSWRGIPVVLFTGAVVLVSAIAAVHGRPLETAQMDLLCQLGIAAAMMIAFVVVHRRKRSLPTMIKTVTQGTQASGSIP